LPPSRNTVIDPTQALSGLSMGSSWAISRDIDVNYMMAGQIRG
jgi:hypothetical protein